MYNTVEVEITYFAQMFYVTAFGFVGWSCFLRASVSFLCFENDVANKKRLLGGTWAPPQIAKCP